LEPPDGRDAQAPSRSPRRPTAGTWRSRVPM
jgi:hypothetical protein